MKRGKSLLGSIFQQNQRLLQDQVEQKQYSRIMEQLKYRPKRLKQFIASYRKAASQRQQHDAYIQFRKQQQDYRRFRMQLKDELEIVETSKSTDDSEYNYVRNQLITAIKEQMNLDLQMNQLMGKRKIQKQSHTLKLQQLQGKSKKVQNALDDILQKARQIKQLQSSIKQCLQLLKIIGVLVKDQGQKIDKVQQNVRLANENIQAAQRKIDVVKKRMQRSTRKKCCVIIIGLIAIVLILVVLYGVSIISL